MKRFKFFRKTAVLFLALLLCLFSASCAKAPPEAVERIPYTVIGTPTAEVYPDGDTARAPWDMILYKGRLYLGHGDFDKNAGPISVYSYDPKSGSFTESPKLPEEEFNRFLLLDGKPCLPGIDPKEDWTLGNYYTLAGGDWIKHRTLPGGIHTFDLVEFEGEIFAGLGVTSGSYPVVRSSDGGDSFGEVVFEKEGAPLDTAAKPLVRTYDLFVFEDTLYATLSLGDAKPDYELYRYDADAERFLFAQSLNDTLARIKFNRQRITAKAAYRGEMLFVTGRLYATGDMQAFREIKLRGVDLVCDLYEDRGDVYLLTATRANDAAGAFKTSVWQAFWVEGETVFYEIFNLYYDLPPLSLAVSGNDFYIGMSDTTAKNELNGTVLQVEY